ncbi:Asp-tRNA(Asn)/Glu-tRNA(Gln) amidotransferase subunit GatC [Candidatus Parcubacteria bacterium]|nr:Asp-tRNA(Asn)/Glu-tRNA(Gln) amidotransferase subunit GatC [Candidatus Parcubacteria bacterium]
MTNPIQESDITKLANLSRISLTEAETSKFTKDLQSIVGMIDVVNSTEISDELLKQEGFAPTNKTREDIEKETGYATPQEIVSAAPNHQDNAVKVKKILGDTE